MPLLWIHKDADSKNLSRSSRIEEAKIRQHVQKTRVRSSISRKPGSRRTQNAPLIGELEDDGSEKSATKENRSSRARKGNRRPEGSEPVPKPLSGRLIQLNSAESRSFAFLERRTCRELPGWRDYSFWNQLALQLAQTSKVVAHSLLSLAALHESWDKTVSHARAANLRLLYLSQSSKAVRAAGAANMTYLEALASCLISLCYHSLVHSKQAFRLLESGTKMLAEYDRQSLDSSNPLASGEESRLIESSIRPLFDRMRCKSCRMSDLSVAFVLSARRRRRAKSLNPVPDLAQLPSIPVSFNGIEAARDCLETVLSWAHDRIPLYEEDLDAQQDFRNCIRFLCSSWEAALNNTRPDIDTIRSKSDSRAKILLQAASLLARIVIETCLADNETVYDEYHPEFQQIIQLIEEATSNYHQTSQISLGIDGGLIDILAFVGSKCRDPVIRRRAMHMLLDGGRVEGDRIAKLPGLILEPLIELEEHGLSVLSQADVPEERRRRIVCGHVFSGQRRIRMFFRPAPIVPGSQQDERDIFTPGSSPATNVSQTGGAPDAIFGSGYAAYLEGDVSQHFQMNLETFYFPIPRV